MSYSNDDTPWMKSQKGNLWCKKNGVILVVGKHKTTDTYWARRGESFLPGRFPTEKTAKVAAESAGAPKLNLDELWGSE